MNMMKKITNRLAFGVVTIVATMLLSSAAFAEGRFYIGGSVGETDVDGFCDDAKDLGLGSCDDTDTGFKVTGGYKINDYLGMEIFYADLGEIDAKGTFMGSPVSAEAELDGFGASLMGSYPMAENVSLYARVGVIEWDADIDVGVSGLGSASEDDDGTDGVYGVGVQYLFGEQLGVRLEWERYDLDDEVDMISLGLAWFF